MNQESSIKAWTTSYGNLAERGSQVAVVPSLQRPYSWDAKKDVGKFWEDILENDHAYYIGSIVMVAGEGTIDREQVIDGQQRLTTLSLILAAIKESIAESEGLEDLVEDINDLLIKLSHREKRKLRLQFSNENSQKVYEAIISGKDLSKYKTDTQKRFVQNFKYIQKKIKEYSPKLQKKEIDSLLQKIKSLELIFIRCTDRASAYRLFESINATGITLASNDLIKNAIFYALRNDKEKLEQAEGGWEEMYEVFNEDSSLLKTYIRHHWISTVGYTSHAKLFDEFTKNYKEEKDVVKYSQDLFSNAKIYQAIRSGLVDELSEITSIRNERNEIRGNLEFLKYLQVDQVYSALLYSYRKDAKKFKKDLVKFASFQLLYKYIPGSPSVPEKIFANFCKEKISKNETFNELLKLCRGQKERFKEDFLNKVKYVPGKSGDLQFLLEKYLYSKKGPDTFKEPTIEHIIPQKADIKTEKKIGKNKKEFLQSIHQIGNLTILENRKNADESIGNQEFKEKKKEYEKDFFEGNREIIKYNFEKNPKLSIQKRGVEIAEAIYEIFLSALETGKWPKK